MSETEEKTDNVVKTEEPPKVEEEPKVVTEEPAAEVKVEKEEEAVVVEGVVVKYMDRKGFGFIVNKENLATQEENSDENGDDRIFFHWKAILSDDRWPTVSEGTEVEFVLAEQSDGRKYASKVTGPKGEKLSSETRKYNKEKKFTGVIKFFDRRKGFGFAEASEDIEEGEITVKKGEELFVGREELMTAAEQDGPPQLRSGMHIEFYVCKTAKGMTCCEVQTTGEVSQPPPDQRQRRKRRNDGNRMGFNPRNNRRGRNFQFNPHLFGLTAAHMRYTGEVVKFNDDKGYGWLQPDRPVVRPSGRTTKTRVYFHVNDIQEQLDVVIGLKLSFLVYHDHKGMGACQILTPKQVEEKKAQEEEHKNDPSQAPLAQAPEPVQPSPPIIPVMHPYDAIPSMIAIQVQNIYVGGLIGKKGVSISELNRNSGCMIQVMDVDDDHSLSPESYRIVTISGIPNNIKQACKLITRRLSDISKSLNARLDFLFNGEMTGRVIGKKGANISKLRGPADKNSPLYVTVNKESHEFDGKQMSSLRIFGPLRDVEKVIDTAVDMLIDLMQTNAQQSWPDDFSNNGEYTNPYSQAFDGYPMPMGYQSGHRY